MSSEKHEFRATFKHGLHGPLVVWAEDESEAALMANAEYRRNAGYVETVSMRPPEDVVDEVVRLG